MNACASKGLIPQETPMNDRRRSSTHEGYEEDTAQPHEGAPSHHASPAKNGVTTTKTLTDPQTGEPTDGRPDTAGGG